jgi:tripartite-type tricarboxylate transporter receptor subunit TctC
MQKNQGIPPGRPPSPVRSARRKLLTCALGTLMLLAGAAPALAAFPDRPLTLVVPFSAGGSTDVLARMLARTMQRTLGQPVIVENRVGAAGAIGAAYVAKSAPDGYTLVFGGVGTNIVTPLTVPETPFNPRTDLAPVGLVCTVDYLLVVNAANPVRDLPDLIARAKRDKGSISYMSTGNKGPLHVGMEFLSKSAGMSLSHVPYKGENAALPDLLASRIDVAMMTVAFTTPMIREGKMRALANLGSQRSASFPDVPTVAELGFPGYALPIWIGISVPAATPPDRIAVLNHALRESLKDDEIQKRMPSMGMTTLSGTPKEFKDFLDREHARWVNMIKEAGKLGD